MDFKLVKNLPSGEKETKLPEPQLDINAIPDLGKLLDNILQLLQYINTDEMQKLELEDNESFMEHVDNKFRNLSIQYYSIFSLLMDRKNREDNVQKIIEMINRLKQVKEGKISLKQADHDYKEEINQRYIYSQWGSKEQFEKAMKKKK